MERIAFYATGIGLLLGHLGTYYLTLTFGVPSFIPTTLLNNLIEWVLWDPKILFFRLQDLGLSCITACYTLYKKDWEGLKQLVKTQAIVGLITEVLKHTVRRMRPNGADTKSFPSGHVSATFTAASYIHERYGIKKALPAYVGASIVGWVRVYKQAHYPTDVLAGASIAILTAYQMTTQQSKRSESDDGVRYKNMKGYGKKRPS